MSSSFYATILQLIPTTVIDKKDGGYEERQTTDRSGATISECTLGRSVRTNDQWHAVSEISQEQGVRVTILRRST